MATVEAPLPKWVNDEGFTVLSDPETPIADIVFIHGIQGHPRRTWRYKGTIEKKTWVVPVTSSPSTPLPPPSSSSPSSIRFWKKKTKPPATPCTSTQAASGSWKTTSEKVSIYWPLDFLPLDHPNVRILTYGYDSHVTKFFGGPTNQINIDSLGRNLLTDLEGIRRAAPERPLIFVAHSLGGLIVKEALRRSAESRFQVHLKAIYDHVSAIMFFGTPHRGSPDGGWGVVLRNVAKAALFDTNAQLLRDMDSASTTGKLENLNESFSDLMLDRDIMITTLQESQGKVGTTVLGLNSKVVSDFSSSVDDRKHENKISINANHMDMCRFESRTDPGYVRFTSALSLHINSIVRNNSEVIRVCMQSLTFDQIHYRRIEIVEAESSTFQWVLDEKLCAFRSWLTSGSQIFWICGKPGSGKSTMMKFLQESSEVTQALSRGQHGGGWMVLTFFFTFKGTRLEKTLEGLLRSLLLQIMQKVPALSHAIKQHGLLETNIGPTFFWELTRLKAAFKEAMTTKRVKICLLVDALDEYEGSIPELIGLLKEIEEHSRLEGSTVKICVASRPHANILIELEHSPGFRMEDCNREDISRFVQQRLKPLLSSHVNDLDFPRLAEAIIERAGGVFLWVSFAVTDLKEGFSYGDTAEDLEKRLLDIPLDMENVYRRILKNTNARYKLELLLMLQIVGRSTEPLSVDALVCAMNAAMAPAKDYNFDTKYKYQTSSLSNTDLSRMIHRIHTISGGLLEVVDISSEEESQYVADRTEYLSSQPILYSEENGTTNPVVAETEYIDRGKYIVILLHKTLEAFLDLPDWTQGLISGKEPTFVLNGHQILLRACAVYFRQFDKALDDVDATIDFTTTRWPFIEYAMYNLAYHARRSERHTGVSSRIILNAISHPLEYPLPTLNRYSTMQFKYDDTYDDITPLELAFGHGLMLYGRDLLREGADPNAGGGKPLRNAALASNTSMVEELFSAGAIITPSHVRANQALVHAAQKGNFAILALLLDHGADPETLGPPNPLQPGVSTALYEAVRMQSSRMVMYLLEKGADIDRGCYRDGKLYLSPLQQAVSSGNMTLTNLLIEKGANVNLKTAHLGGALATARYHGDMAMVERLTEAGSSDLTKRRRPNLRGE